MRELEDIDSAKQDPSGSNPGRRFLKEPGNRVRECALARTGFADDPEHAARRDLQRQVGYRVEDASANLVVDGETLYVQERLCHLYHASAAAAALAINVEGIAA